MKQYLIFGLTILGLIGCTTTSVNSLKKENNNTIKSKNILENNSTKKVLTVDLDKEIKEDFSKGGIEEQIIPIIIGKYRGDSDEVALKGDFLKKVNKIKIGDNDEVAFKGEEYRVKTSELKDGDFIILYGDNDEVKLRIRDY